MDDNRDAEGFGEVEIDEDEESTLTDNLLSGK